MRIAAFVPDLLDRSRFPSDGVDFIGDVTDLDGLTPEVVVVDLDRCAEPNRFVGRGRRVVAYGSHVEADALDAASMAGFDDVMPRSVFFRRLAELINTDA